MRDQLIIDSMHYRKQNLQYGNESIPYRVFFVAPFRHKIKIEVLPNGSVQVIAPEATSLSSIKKAVQKRARWLYQQYSKIKRQQHHVLPREYVSGESHFYLGRRYLLKMINVKTIQPHVKLTRGQIQVRTRSRQPEIIKALLNDWYRDHAEQVFERRLEALVSNISWLNAPPPWKIRRMKKQWGSCSPKGVLTLNPLLVKAPRECIDYVILHELCHLKEHNHSRNYYRWLSRLCPRWEITKARLDGLSELLLVE